jgi:hypothetical protein
LPLLDAGDLSERESAALREAAAERMRAQQVDG